MVRKQLIKAQDVADIFEQPLHAVWRNVREGLYDDFTVKISPHRYRFDPDRLEEFIQRGGVRLADNDAMAQAA
jgi:hypothetical protein